MLIVIGYHTLEDRDNVDQIEETGPVKCTSKRAWLGFGYYFWDTDIYWAHGWGKQYPSYVIFEAGLLINNKTFDLFGSVKHINTFLKWVDDLVGMKVFKRNEVTIPNVIEYMKKHVDFSLI